MLEKLSVSLIAGVPSIVKPATSTCYLAEAAFRILIETGKVPDGALQFIAGSTGDLFDHLTGQDVVSFTGSAQTAAKLKSHPVIIRESVKFVAEQDSLNASMLGPDAGPDSPEFALFAKEVVREMTVKAGQKCTAIRRALVPAAMLDAAQKAISDGLAKTTIGDPAREDVRMGALVSLSQREDVRAKVGALKSEAKVVFGDAAEFDVIGASAVTGAFASPMLLRCDDPWSAKAIHEVEAFGPVSTLMPYKNLDDAIDLCNKGGGSLVMSLFTHDPEVARDVVIGAGCFHGRVAVINRDCAKESPGTDRRFRSSCMAAPAEPAAARNSAACAASNTTCSVPPFRGRRKSSRRNRPMGSKALQPKQNRRIRSDTVSANSRSARRSRPQRARSRSMTSNISPILPATRFTPTWTRRRRRPTPSFRAASPMAISSCPLPRALFVDPAPGPVLANYGLDSLRFMQPVYPGDRMRSGADLQAENRARGRGVRRGTVGDAEVTNQDDAIVANYDLLTLVARAGA